MTTEKIRLCPKCGGKKKFYPNSGAYLCVKCTLATQANWRKRNEAQYKRARQNAYLRLRYGWHIEGYEAVLESQQNCCAICKCASSTQKRMLAVDHDHETGWIRGLLCQNCNYAIGILNKESLLKAANHYLRNAVKKGDLRHVKLPDDRE